MITRLRRDVGYLFQARAQRHRLEVFESEVEWERQVGEEWPMPPTISAVRDLKLAVAGLLEAIGDAIFGAPLDRDV